MSYCDSFDDFVASRKNFRWHDRGYWYSYARLSQLWRIVAGYYLGNMFVRKALSNNNVPSKHFSCFFQLYWFLCISMVPHPFPKKVFVSVWASALRVFISFVCLDDPGCSLKRPLHNPIRLFVS